MQSIVGGQLRSRCTRASAPRGRAGADGDSAHAVRVAKTAKPNKRLRIAPLRWGGSSNAPTHGHPPHAPESHKDLYAFAPARAAPYAYQHENPAQNRAF